MSMAISMASVQLHSAVAAAVIPFTSRSASGLPSCTEYVHAAFLSRLSSMTRPPEMPPTCLPACQPCLPACLPTCLPACLPTGAEHRLVRFPYWLGASIISHPTARDTRPDPSYPVLQACPTGAGRRPVVAPPSDDHLVLVVGWSHTSNGSLNYYILLGTPQPVSGPSVLGHLRKGKPPILAPGPYVLSTSQHPSNPAEDPGPFFETAAVGRFTSWVVQSCFCLSGGLKLVGG